MDTTRRKIKVSIKAALHQFLCSTCQNSLTVWSNLPLVQKRRNKLIILDLYCARDPSLALQRGYHRGVIATGCFWQQSSWQQSWAAWPTFCHARSCIWAVGSAAFTLHFSQDNATDGQDLTLLCWGPKPSLAACVSVMTQPFSIFTYFGASFIACIFWHGVSEKKVHEAGAKIWQITQCGSHSFWDHSCDHMHKTSLSSPLTPCHCVWHKSGLSPGHYYTKSMTKSLLFHTSSKNLSLK